MDENFQINYEILQQFEQYNFKRVNSAIEYYIGICQKGEDVDLLIPLLKKFYEKNESPNIRGAIYLMLLIYINKKNYDEIYGLTLKVKSWQFKEAIEKIIALQPIDVYALIDFLSDKYNNGAEDLFFIYKKHIESESDAAVKKTKTFYMFEKIISADNYKKIQLPNFIYNALNKEYPLECFQYLKKILYEPAHIYSTLWCLYNFIPKFHKELVQDFPYIENLKPIKEEYLYAKRWFLLSYYFYHDDFDKVREILIPISSVRSNSLYESLSYLIIDNPDRQQKYIQLFLEAFKTDDDNMVKSLNTCFQNFYDNKIDLPSNFVDSLIQNLDNPCFAPSSLQVFYIYKFELSKYLNVSHKNPYLNHLLKFPLSTDSVYCEYCSEFEFKLYESIYTCDIDMLEKYNDTDTWSQCIICGQDLIYNKISYPDGDEHEEIIKSNPIEILSKIKNQDSKEKLKRDYPAKLEKAKKDAYASCTAISFPAAVFLSNHYINEKDYYGYYSFLKTLASNALYHVLDNLHTTISVKKYPFSNIDFLNIFMESKFCQHILGKCLSLTAILKKDDLALLKLLQSENVDFLDGVLSNLSHFSKMYTASRAIVDRIYSIGIMFPDSRQVSLFMMMQFGTNSHSTLNALNKFQNSDDEKELKFLLNCMSLSTYMIPSLSVAHIEKLLKLAESEYMGKSPASFLSAMIYHNQIQQEALMYLLRRFAENRYSVCHIYAKQDYALKSIEKEIVDYCFNCIRKSKEHIYWMEIFSDILKNCNHEIVQKNLIYTLVDFSKLRSNLSILIEPLLEKYKEPYYFLKDEITIIFKHYYRYHFDARLSSFLS